MGESKIVPDPPKYDRSRLLPTVELVYQNKLPNCPGKSSVGLRVTYPPNGSTPPHRHAGASVSAFVIKGTMLSKMNDGPTEMFQEGESWFEAPGCHHKVSDNHSLTDSATLFATLVVDTEVVEKGGVAALVEYDEEYRNISH
ncbi:cupin domain-containing protein [Trichoderma breve]|uniref:Cupin domain-containing protein n=1 Tax=Trichoderma breve TaxID=2034170 RepID=A0A9W9BDV0_9HYPO|nr:cupin domain-containing protein [Trichoderma breve]KAJ4861340.1 cupin domain-containing protein [Trichoderma breve]